MSYMSFSAAMLQIHRPARTFNGRAVLEGAEEPVQPAQLFDNTDFCGASHKARKLFNFCSLLPNQILQREIALHLTK